jgi:hypothetical protein
MSGIRVQVAAIAIVVPALLYAVTGHAQEVTFIPSTAAHGYAVRAYEAIWEEYGDTIISALESRTCLRFPEINVSAIVADATSNSGGPDHPMRLRASYRSAVKQSTLVHELGHRHLWQLAERLDDVDGHMTLYLVLDDVWADVWGKEFAENRVIDESSWRSNYDYAAAWTWARSLNSTERAHLWDELLKKNGFADNCRVATTDLETLSAG